MVVVRDSNSETLSYNGGAVDVIRFSGWQNKQTKALLLKNREENEAITLDKYA